MKTQVGADHLYNNSVVTTNVLKFIAKILERDFMKLVGYIFLKKSFWYLLKMKKIQSQDPVI